VAGKAMTDTPGAFMPESIGYAIKCLVLGKPMVSEQLKTERLSNPVALGVLSPDAISSSAYGTEEILIELLPFAGLAAFTLLLPITGVILLILVVVAASYRQVVLARDGIDPQGSVALTSDGGPYTRFSQGAAVSLPCIFAHRDVGDTDCPGNLGYAVMNQIRDIAARFNKRLSAQDLAQSMQGTAAGATFPELLVSEAPIQVNDSLLMSDKQLVNLIFRWPVTGQWSPETMTAAIKASWEHFEASVLPTLLTTPSGATEERTWKALDISETELADWSARLWNRTFPEERDRRAGAGANAQKRGQISRQMRKELQAAIEVATHGDDK
jgi:hypothetical protein